MWIAYTVELECATLVSEPSPRGMTQSTGQVSDHVFAERVACVASVSVGCSARSRRFSHFGGAKVGADATLMEAAGTFLRSPQSSRVQKAKNASNLRKALRKRLLSRLRRGWLGKHQKNSRNFQKRLYLENYVRVNI